MVAKPNVWTPLEKYFAKYRFETRPVDLGAYYRVLVLLTTSFC